ncbi:hypothetical protein BDZ85DRAFT_270762 [Elsinoe ampelina]|uniref:Uncharacterized protein n=1 Tax=Elsinoe ampelina TaxID=302913 RepID=A0A6A6FYG9_9PEZI|nr:hypothetical protein BDZ85DRAFT_270762 [Elsinoe ampelina]
MSARFRSGYNRSFWSLNGVESPHQENSTGGVGCSSAENSERLRAGMVEMSLPCSQVVLCARQNGLGKGSRSMIQRLLLWPCESNSSVVCDAELMWEGESNVASRKTTSRKHDRSQIFMTAHLSIKSTVVGLSMSEQLIFDEFHVFFSDVCVHRALPLSVIRGTGSIDELSQVMQV